tara:strand:- start:412 stop:525 length:114 start_codon:yes stop_codon:yes gene_type:complete
MDSFLEKFLETITVIIFFIGFMFLFFAFGKIIWDGIL